jgi:DNA mismatch repair protein MutL
MEVRLSKEQELNQLVTEAIKNVFKTKELIPAGFVAKKAEKSKSEQTFLDLDHLPESGRRPGLLRDERVAGGNFIVPSENDAGTQHDGGNIREQGLPHQESLERGIPENLPGDREEIWGFVGEGSSPVSDDLSSLASEAMKQRSWGAEQEAEDHFSSCVQEKAVQPADEGLDLPDDRPAVAAAEPVAMDEEALPSRVPPLYPIGQMHGTYILAQNDRGLYIIDQHAAQERIKYEYFRDKVGQVASELQDMLVPLTFEYSPDDCIRIDEYLHELEKVGVFLESFGHNSYIVRSHPQWFPRGEEKELIEEMIEQLLSMKRVDIKKLREEAAILMSCKGSIKANRHLRNDEIQSLLDELRRSSDPFTCPHGRPIIVHYSTYEMEKMFKRVT